jgi:hypothetical protein
VRRVTAALLAAAVGVGVLGAAAPASGASGGAAKACALLTRPEIDAAFGQPAGKGSDDLGSAFCQWDLAATDDRVAGQVNAFVARGKAAKRNYVPMAKAVGDRIPVAGIGRKAFYRPATGTLFVLLDGATFFYVQANLYADAQTRITDGVHDGLAQLATQAGARL